MAAKTFKTQSKLFRTLEPYLYLAPATIILVLVFLYPIIQVVRLSFLQPLVGGNTAVSLFNYQMVFEDPVFWQGVRNNGELLLTVPFMTLLGLLLAVLLYERVIGWKIYRTLIYMPSWRFRRSAWLLCTCWG